MIKMGNGGWGSPLSPSVLLLFVSRKRASPSGAGKGGGVCGLGFLRSNAFVLLGFTPRAEAPSFWPLTCL